ncbi:MAG: FAD/NAD(P)-binding protein [Sphingobium sp.]
MSKPFPQPCVAIVGAGLSGTLLAVNLLRLSGVHVVLIERSDARVARGVAYSTDNPQHLLNVRASNMSAFPDVPTHFLDWLGASQTTAQNRFVERRTFGAYIGHLLDTALADHAQRLTVIHGEAQRATRRDGGGWSVDVRGHGRIACDILVLAQGNLAPSDLPVLGDLAPPVYFADPWSPGATEGLAPEDDILLVGSGLTAVDVALTLESAGHRGTIHALSRRGLRPRSHSPVGPHAKLADAPTATGAKLLREVRASAGEVGWRYAIDALRPHTQDIWRAMSVAERARFLRHLRPYWDVHRHRLAPGVDQKVSALQMEGRLRFVAGKIVAASATDGGAVVTWRVRGNDSRRTVPVQRIINCTGPSGDIAKCIDPLLSDLRDRGLAVADPLHLGLDVEAGGQLRSAAGELQPDLLAVGPLTRSESWEIIAVPDIRRQVWETAQSLANRYGDVTPAS